MTPHIDQALAYFRQRTKIPVQSSVSSSTERVSSSEPEKSILDKIQSEMRIQKLEDQISQILQKVNYFSMMAQKVLFVKQVPFDSTEVRYERYTVYTGTYVDFIVMCI